MRVLDIMAWVVVVLGTLATIYTAAMLATGPARARRTRRGAHGRVALAGPGAPREAWGRISRFVPAVASGIILLTIKSMSHVRWLLLVPIVAVLVIDQVLSYRDRHRAPAEPP
jgi:hypothetical protein